MSAAQQGFWTVHYTPDGNAYEFNLVTLESRWACSSLNSDQHHQQHQAFLHQQAAAYQAAQVDVDRVQAFALHAEAVALEAQASHRAAPRTTQAELDAIVIQRAQAHLRSKSHAARS